MRKVFIVIVLAALLVALLPTVVTAADPTVAITVTAQVMAITNTQDTWGIGIIATSQNVKWGASDTYSTVTNTGNINVWVRIQGTDLTGGTTWSLAADGAPGEDIYGLKATITSDYGIIVKKSGASPVDLVANLPHTSSNTETWSMTFWSPTSLTVPTDVTQKSGTVTLIARATA